MKNTHPVLWDACCHACAATYVSPPAAEATRPTGQAAATPASTALAPHPALPPARGLQGGNEERFGGDDTPHLLLHVSLGGGRPPLLRALRCTHPPGSGSIKPYPERHMSYRHRHASPERHLHRITHGPLPLTHDPHIAPQTEWRMPCGMNRHVCVRGGAPHSSTGTRAG